jgi:phage terminase large subunit-like protein
MGTARRIALVNDTAADVRDVMIEGPSGLLAIAPPGFRPTYEPSKRRLTWPNGSMAIAYAAEAPELLRGPEHDLGWADELAKWRNLRKADTSGGTAWDNLLMGLRIGTDPRVVVSTTPRQVAVLRRLIASPGTVVTRGHLADNAENLAPEFVTEMRTRYEGSRLGRQELAGELLEDVEGALWSPSYFERDGFRVATAPACWRLVVAIDPAVTSTATSAESGIVVAGKTEAAEGYVLADLSLRGSPDQWARRAVAAYRDFRADRIVAEANQGGDLVASVLATVAPHVPVTLVHASRGKRVRAEPVAALYEQGRIHHVGTLDVLEDQLTTWDPDSGESPDRLDALVWALTDLLIDEPISSYASGMIQPGAGAYHREGRAIDSVWGGRR